jgi:hypothetical protein
MVRILPLAVAAALAGCVNYGAFVTHGYINFAPATGPGYSYAVTFKNITDFGFDGDNRDDRLKAVAALLGDKCPRPVFIDESMIETGKLPLGRPVRTYTAKVQCPGAA